VRSKWKRLLIAGTVFVAAVACLAAVFLGWGFVRVRSALEAIRSSGEPTTPAEIRFPDPASASDLTERVRAHLDAPHAGLDLWFLSGAHAEALDELRTSGADAAGIAAAEILFSCLGDDAVSSFDLRDAAAAALSDPDVAQSLPPCIREFVLARAAVQTPLIASAQHVLAAEPDACEELVRAWTPIDGPAPDAEAPPIRATFAVREVGHLAVAHAVEGRSPEAIAQLELAFRGANLLRDPAWTMAWSARCMAWSQAIVAFQQSLAFLPHDADLTRILDALDAGEPERGLERALLGDRAFGNETLVELQDGRLAGLGGGVVSVPRGFAGALTWAMLAHDRAFYLEFMTQAVAWSRRPWHATVDEVERAIADWQDSGSLRFAIAAPMLVPRIDGLLQSAAYQRAQMELARAAILAHTQGVDAAIAAAEHAIDPFDGHPLRWRIEPNGVLTLWSIGPDRVDDAGATYETESEGGTTDIAWRIRPR
jgi:hypothetical protein